MRRQHFNVDRHEAVSHCEPLHGDKREIREMLVVNRIELVFRDKPFDMRNLEGYHALRS